MSSLALLAAGARRAKASRGGVIGGHGELFVQRVRPKRWRAGTEFATCPRQRSRGDDRPAGCRIGRRGNSSMPAAGAKRAKLFPRRPTRFGLPEMPAHASPKPVYARAPDARAKEAA